MDKNKQLFLNKYKPIYFNDFQTHNDIITIVDSLIKLDNLNILLIGDGGTGKTTLLNATVKEYYKNYPFKQFENNILYINSLKEQGINYYRNDVKIFCQTCSAIKNKKKIVIIDDMDSINEQSQQIFRNYIDKYSHNVHFITSCSNSQKVIETLQSRLIVLKIKSLQKNNLQQIMQNIIVNENINITAPAKHFILNISNNNAKVMINYMEKCKLVNKNIDINLANQICTNISFIELDRYFNLIKDQNISDAITLLYNIYDKGYSVMDILDNIFLYIKSSTLLTETHKYNITPIICKYITIFHNIHEHEIELALFTNNIIKIFNN